MASSSLWSALEGNGPTIISTGMSGVTSITSSDPAAMLNQQLASALSTMGDAQYWEESIAPSTIRQSLAEADPSNTSSTQVLMRGMKWLLASISKGRDVSDFYPHVVKLVGAASLEVRKMVYMYLVQYADHDATTRELSLLSINSFQRGLADAEQLIRALALRVLTSIRIPDILQIQVLAVQSCARDKSPYVRKCSANALAKLAPRCGDADNNNNINMQQEEQLVEILCGMLDSDTATMVLTSCLITFTELCPNRLDLLHGSFRKVCHLLTDMDEWGQVVVIDIMARYCRQFFKEPAGWRDGTAERIDRERRVRRTIYGVGLEKLSLAGRVEGRSVAEQAVEKGIPLPPRNTPDSPRKVKRRTVKKAFYSDEEDASSEEEVYAESLTGPALPLSSAMRQRNILGVPGSTSGTNGIVKNDEDFELAEDHRLLLHSAMPLLKSRNAGVVLAVCSLQYYCGISSVKVRAAMGKALVRIHRDRREIQYVVLSSIRTLVTECPSAFAPFLHDFFVKALDPPFTRLIKLEILTSLALEPAAIEAVLKEMRTYVRHGDKTFVCAAVRAVGKIVELARIVFDRHGARSGDRSRERAESNKIALNCLFGLVTLSQTSESAEVVGECVMAMQRILQLLQSDAAGEGDLMGVEDSKCVQDRARRRIAVLLAYTLSSRIRKDEIETTGDIMDEVEEDSPLEKIAVILPPNATASALWIVGEHMTSTTVSPQFVIGKSDKHHRPKTRLEVIRLIARAFPELSAVEKEQGIHMATKLLLSGSNGVAVAAEEVALCEHVLTMGRLDTDPGVRDRARFESGVVRSTVGLSHDVDNADDMPEVAKKVTMEQAKAAFLQNKPVPSTLPLEETFTTSSGEAGGFRFGSLSSLVCHRARSAYVPLPSWADKDSSGALREAKAEKKSRAGQNGSVVGTGQQAGFYGGDPDNSSSSSSRSSSDSDSDSESASDEADSSSSSSSSSSGEDSPDMLTGMLSNGDMPLLSVDAPAHPGRRQTSPAANGNANKKKSTLKVKNESDSSSSSSDSGESDNESSSSSSDESIAEPATTTDGGLIPMGAAGDAIKSKTAIASSTAADAFVGMTLENEPVKAAAATTDSRQADHDLDGGCASVWYPLVRPALAHGLSLQIRYLRHPAKMHVAKTMGYMVDKPTLVVCELAWDLAPTANAVRRLKLLQRAATSSSATSLSSSSTTVVAPRKVVLPAEVDVLVPGACLRKQYVVIDFATASDRDGALVAKLEVRSSTGGGIAVEIKPALADLLQPLSMNATDFDARVSQLHGFGRIESKITHPANKRGELSMQLVQYASLTPIDERTMVESHVCCFAGHLPASNDAVYVSVANLNDEEIKLIVCSDNALAVNSIMNVLKRALRNLS